MLDIIDSESHPLFSLITTDPVRPEIPPLRRIAQDCSVFAWLDQDRLARCLLCCRYTNSVPSSVDELFAQVEPADTAVFYSIWSLRSGGARDLILAARAWILEHKPNIVNFITLSPPTDMARDFHLRNGAHVYRINQETINYQYESRNT